MTTGAGIRIGELRGEDEAAAVRFAIRGMHLDRYLPEGPLLNAYGWYFWSSELLRATQVIAAYDDDRFLGVLLADMKGEPAARRTPFWRGLCVKTVSLLERAFAGAYDSANREMLEEYLKDADPDGEICFLAADPDTGKKGVGTALLRELERREPGKRVHLYTDDGCTWQFYEHRGFARAGERTVLLGIAGRRTTLKCFLYDKWL